MKSGSDDLDFNIQRLGLWIRYNQKSAISPNEWKELQIKPPPKLTGDLFVGIKYGHVVRMWPCRLQRGPKMEKSSWKGSVAGKSCGNGLDDEISQQLA